MTDILFKCTIQLQLIYRFYYFNVYICLLATYQNWIRTADDLFETKLVTGMWDEQIFQYAVAYVYYNSVALVVYARVLIA